jgi:hypothetical protein
VDQAKGRARILLHRLHWTKNVEKCQSHFLLILSMYKWNVQMYVFLNIYRIGTDPF